MNRQDIITQVVAAARRYYAECLADGWTRADCRTAMLHYMLDRGMAYGDAWSEANAHIG